MVGILNFLGQDTQMVATIATAFDPHPPAGHSGHNAFRTSINSQGEFAVSGVATASRLSAH